MKLLTTLVILILACSWAFAQSAGFEDVPQSSPNGEIAENSNSGSAGDFPGAQQVEPGNSAEPGKFDKPAEVEPRCSPMLSQDQLNEVAGELQSLRGQISQLEAERNDYAHESVVAGTARNYKRRAHYRSKVISTDKRIDALKQRIAVLEANFKTQPFGGEANQRKAYKNLQGAGFLTRGQADRRYQFKEEGVGNMTTLIILAIVGLIVLVIALFAYLHAGGNNRNGGGTGTGLVALANALGRIANRQQGTETMTVMGDLDGFTVTVGPNQAQPQVVVNNNQPAAPAGPQTVNGIPVGVAYQQVNLPPATVTMVAAAATPAAPAPAPAPASPVNITQTFHTAQPGGGQSGGGRGGRGGQQGGGQQGGGQQNP